MSNYTKKFLIDFFETYREYTCLWKIKSPEYHDKFARKTAMEALTNKFKEIEPEVNEEIVKKKINNFRTSYKRELKLVQKSKKSGAGSDEIYVPKLWYYDYLTFLDDQEIPSASTSNLSGEDEVIKNKLLYNFILPADGAFIIKIIHKLYSNIFC